MYSYDKIKSVLVIYITGHIKNRTVVYMYSFFNMYINSICIYVKYILF